MSRKVIVVIAVALLAITAGCTGGGGGASDAGNGNGNGAGNGNGDAMSAGNGNGNGNGNGAASGSDPMDSPQANPSQPDRQLIRTASLELEIDSFADARADLTAAARGYGGYVADSEVQTRERHNETWTVGTLTYRVPSEAYTDFYADVEAAGNVTRASTGTEDVTDQLVDLEARIENLEAQRDRLRDLYEEANETEDVLAVQDELSDVQEEIEQLEAKRASLEDRVAYSTVTVTLAEPEPEPERDETAATEEEAEPAWHETGVPNAFLSSIGGVVTVFRALIVAAAYLAPYFLAFGVPIGLAYAVVRRRGGGGERFDPDE